MEALKIQKLFKKYQNDNFAISNVNFNVSENAFHLLIGKNGSGKTTIIKSIVGAYKKFEGDIQIFNKSNLESSSRKKLAYIPEKAIFPKGLTTLQYLSFIYSVCENVSVKEARKEALKHIEDFNLLAFKDENPNFFSSGQKKRVLLAQALMKKAKIIIMDEPTAALDPLARQSFFTLLKKINDQGTTIVIATHVINEVQDLANEITIVEKGKIKFTGKLGKQNILNLYKKHISNKEVIYA